MPIIQIKFASHRSTSAREIAEAVAELTETVLKKQRPLMSIVVEDVSPEAWFIAGRSLAEHGLATYWLDIKVTDGTNERADVQRYLAAVHDRMAALLGPLHAESYAYVHEVDGNTYGYGGHSQNARFFAAAHAQPGASAGSAAFR